MPTQVNQVPDSWVFDPAAVEHYISRKTRQPMWRGVVATLRLIDGAQRTTGPRKVDLLRAAIKRLAHARLQLRQHGVAEPASSHWTASPLTTDIRAHDSMQDDVAWLRDALADPGEPSDRHVAAVLDSLADNVLTALRLATAEGTCAVPNGVGPAAGLQARRQALHQPADRE